MKILVTGGTGFLGTALCRKLAAQGHEVTAFGSASCDLTTPGGLRKFEEQQFDRIYHLAAWTQAGDFCLKHPGEQWIINQRINTNLLHWWHERQPQAKLICAGSSCAYDPELPLKEENYLTGIPIDSLFTYAMTKRMLYAGLLALNRQFGHRYLCLVPSTLYGPGYPDDGRQKHFIFDLITKIIRGKLHEEPVVLWGDGNQRRELVHIDDFVDTMLALSDSVENDIVNVGCGEEFSIKHFARLICKQVGYDFQQIQFDETRYVGARSKCLDITKLKRLLPTVKFKSLEAGLSQTVTELLKKNPEVSCNTQ